MFPEERAKLREWLTLELAEFEVSGELHRPAAERILEHVWKTLAPAIEERIEQARADGHEAGWDLRADCERD